MAKKTTVGSLISPSNLWGKPLPQAEPAPAASQGKKVARKMTDDDDIMDEQEIDVDAELAEVDVDDEELHAVESELGSDAEDDGEPEESDEDEAGDEEPDYDAEDGDIKAEADDVAETEVVTSVVDDEEQEEETTVVSSKKGKGSMADNKLSLSDHVRNEIERRKNSGDSLRGKDIVEALAKRKIEVSPAQVSQLLKKAGLGGKPRKRRETAVAAGERSRSLGKARKREPVAAAPTQPRIAPKGRSTGSQSFRVPMTQLQAAETFVDACGGSFKDAEKILTAAAQLSETFGG
jgi:transposase